jgi:hypothetical protein
MDVGQPLTAENIRAALRLYERLPDWGVTDHALAALAVAFPGFTPEAVLLKAAAINQLYATQVWDIGGMYAHVLDVFGSPWQHLAPADLVKRLAAVPGRTHTSFAAKFCHFFIDQERFPIYDFYADWMVRWHLGRRQAASEPTHAYRAFLTNLYALRKRDQIVCTSRELDRYLWIAGQYRWWKRKGAAAGTNTELRKRLFERGATDPAVEADLDELAGLRT